MNSSIETYWERRLENCKAALEDNNFAVYIAENPSHAREIVLNTILPEIDVKSASWGGSLTLDATGILDDLKQHEDIHLIETFGENISQEKLMECRRKALLTDLFLTGTNAVTETGSLVNLDRIGNRVAGITFGPRHVVIMVGRNKIVPDLEEAMNRIKNYAAPANAIRLNKKTPCVKTSYCSDCKSIDRICNIMTIHDKSFPKGRIRVILINQDLGL